MTYKEYKEKALKDPKVKAGYDALQPEYDLIQAMVEARLGNLVRVSHHIFMS